MCEICANIIRASADASSTYKGYSAFADEIRDGIWNNRLDPGDLHLKTVRRFHKDMFKQITDELGWGGFETLKPGSVRYNRLASLELNSFVFSSLKNYEFLNTLTGIRKKMGITKAEFDKEFNAAHEMIYNLHSAVELEHARSVATSIRTWENVERYGDTMPFLTYQTAGDERVRPAHAALDNITRMWNDQFWDVYYPPNGYRCRCYVTQDFEGEITDLPKEKMAKLPAPDKGFDLNWGKQKRTWQKSHTYLNLDFSKHQKVNDRISKLLQGNLKAFYKVDPQIFAHPLVGSELEDNIAIAKLIGGSIRLNPEIKLNRFKNVDTWINGKPTEFKSQKGLQLGRFLHGRLADALDQRASIVVLQVKTFDENIIIGRLDNLFKANPDIQVRLIWKGKIQVFTSKDYKTKLLKHKSS